MFLLECLLFVSHPIIIHIPFFHWVPHHSNNPFLESSPIVYQYQTPSFSSICISQLHIYSCITFFVFTCKRGGGVQVKGWVFFYYVPFISTLICFIYYLNLPIFFQVLIEKSILFHLV